MPCDLQEYVDRYGPYEWVRLMMDANDPDGKRRLIRGKASTLLHFGLDALDPVPTAYVRNGGIHLGPWQYGNGNTNWRTIKAVIPEKWNGSRRHRAWGFSVNRHVRVGDLVTLGKIIEAAGVPFLGFYNNQNAWIYKHIKTSHLSHEVAA